MNFLLRGTHLVTPLSSIAETDSHKDKQPTIKRSTTLAGLIAEDSCINSSSSEDEDKESDGVGDRSGAAVGSSSKNQASSVKHSDVAEDEGWIIIPCKELPEDWTDASDILKLRPLDRSFVFPGEQLHILVCLTAAKQDTAVITPFKVATVISKNDSSAENGKQQIEVLERKSSSTIGQGDVNGTHEATHIQDLEGSDETMSTAEATSEQDISAVETLLWRDHHKQKTDSLLERFRNSNFFVRIAQSDEPLWSKKNEPGSSLMNSDMPRGRFRASNDGSRETSGSNLFNAVVDRGSFDGNSSGGVARSSARCYSLCNGDIVVVLQVIIANTVMKDPILEVLQFEKYNVRNSSSENLISLMDDPCRELINWLLPLDRTLPPPRPLSPPLFSASVLASASHKATPVSSSSQIFSFGHFRSYSMPTIPQITLSSAVTPSNVKPMFDLEDIGRFSSEKLTEFLDTTNETLLSFRGVPLEPQRFSAHCGLEGIYLPGRRWRRKLEIIQPIEMNSFTAECVTEDLLCVQIKNVSPPQIPDIMIFLDAITIVFEEASKGGAHLSLPIASIETGDGYSLPNLALRRGEEHSFILKPVTAMFRDQKGPNITNSWLSHSKIGASVPSMHLVSRLSEGRRLSPSEDQYAVIVSYRCNYTESTLFFKKSTCWRPRVARDLMISITSDRSKQTVETNGEAPQLPVQVLTLQASNLTSEDLTLTVVAPMSSNSPPSVVSLNSGPTTPLSPFLDSPEFTRIMCMDKRGTSMQRLTSLPNVPESQKENDVSEKRSIFSRIRPGAASGVISSNCLGCTHLWLRSIVPLGCVPAHSTATIKLELLPLTDGIISLDTLQVDIKEKGQMYTPEQSLKIFVTSIADGIM